MPTIPGLRANFGPVVVETDVDEAVMTTLRRWLPTYLTELERARELDVRTFQRPKSESYANTIEDDEFLDHRLPAIIVTTARTQEAPQRLGGGMYAVNWAVVVSSVVRGATPRETRWVASNFGGAVRHCLVQQSDLEGFANGVRWVGSQPMPVDDTTEQGRYLAALVNTFTVFTDQVLQDGRGPVPNGPYDEPDPEGDPDTPYLPLLPVEKVTTAVEGVPITATPGDNG